MKWSLFGLSLFLLLNGFKLPAQGTSCGFPGRPAFGRLVKSPSANTLYSEGDTVYFQCNSGYYMKGGPFRRCLPSGIWSGPDLPICDTTLANDGLGKASSREALLNYPPELATDGNPRTCFYSNRHQPRWWRIDMTTNWKVLSVAVTVPFASSEHFFTVYVIHSNESLTNENRCSSFNGIFVTQTNILVCGSEGIEGRFLHIQDNSKHFEYFGLCEIKIFVEKESHECGMPEEPANSYPIASQQTNQVEYNCLAGFEIKGPRVRNCQRNGQWSGQQAVCQEVTCPKPEPSEHGRSKESGSSGGRSAQFSEAHYSCDSGYYLLGNGTRICSPTGEWSGMPPSCEPVDCGEPSELSRSTAGRLILLNGSTTFLNLAQLQCYDGHEPVGGNTIIHCREDGTWSELFSTCRYKEVSPAMESRISNINSNPRNIDSRVGTILASVIFGVLFCILVLIGFLFKRGRRERRSGRDSGRKSSLKPTEINEMSRHYASNLMLSEFRCSLPMTRTTTSLTRVASNQLDSDLYEEIRCEGGFNERGIEVGVEGEGGGSGWGGGGGGNGCLSHESTAAGCEEVQRNKTGVPEGGGGWAEGGGAGGGRRGGGKDELNSSAVLALYAKVDFVQKRKQRLRERKASTGGRTELVHVDIEKVPARFKGLEEVEEMDEAGERGRRPENKGSPFEESYLVIDTETQCEVYADHPALRPPPPPFSPAPSTPFVSCPLSEVNK